jgi:hypothetical protein
MAIQTLISQLLFDQESNTLDFKSKQYIFTNATDEEKSELLKDILAFANVWRRTDAYILIGVKEVKGGRSKPVGIADHLEDANLQQFINSKIQRPIDFSYRAIEFESIQIGVIQIPVQRRPFYLKKDFGKLAKSQVYIRRGSSTDIASIDEISNMGNEIKNSQQEYPSLDTFLIDGEHGEVIQKHIDCKVINATIPEDEEFPDYGVMDYLGYKVSTIMLSNTDYYRDYAKFIQSNFRVHQFRFGVKNHGAIVARDVKVVFDVSNEQKTSIACKTDNLPSRPSTDRHSFLLRNTTTPKPNDITVSATNNGWRVTCYLGKIQPKDIAITKNYFCLGSLVSKSIKIDIQVFSDDLPEPKKETLEVDFEVENRNYTVMDFTKK